MIWAKDVTNRLRQGVRFDHRLHPQTQKICEGHEWSDWNPKIYPWMLRMIGTSLPPHSDTMYRQCLRCDAEIHVQEALWREQYRPWR
jgi:hypothetical protein